MGQLKQLRSPYDRNDHGAAPLYRNGRQQALIEIIIAAVDANGTTKGP